LIYIKMADSVFKKMSAPPCGWRKSAQCQRRIEV
jgi:hypothetical protein